MSKQQLSEGKIIDPAVQARLDNSDIFSGIKKKRQEMRMTPAMKREQQRLKDRTRVFFDGSKKLTQILDTRSGEEGVPRSQLICHLLAHALQDLQAGRIPLEKKPSRSTLYKFNLVVAEPTEAEDSKGKKTGE
jgi:hypothetical protein